MNCPKCNASVDYRFPTTCQHCQTELPCLTTDIAPIQSSTPTTQPRCCVGIVHFVRKAFLVLVTSGMCTVAGAILLYAVARVFYQMFLYDPTRGGCGHGMELFITAILTGAFLGCAGGSIAGYKFRLSPDPLAE